MRKHIFAICLASTLIFAQPAGAQDCNAPELICKAAANQDRSLYMRDRCRYEQKIRVERFKLKDGSERMEEVRETSVSVEPSGKPDKTGQTPVIVLEYVGSLPNAFLSLFV